MQYYDLLSHGSAKELGFTLAPGLAKEFKHPKSIEDTQRIARKRGALLLNPFTQSKLLIDAGLLQTCKDRDVSIAISFSGLLSLGPRARAGWLVQCRKLVQLCKRKKNRVVIVSGATNAYEVRTPLQLEAFARVLGFSSPQAKWALTRAPEYITRTVGK